MTPAPHKHTCAAEGCTEQVSVKFLMCWPHWRRVPKKIQQEIWRTLKYVDRTEYDFWVAEAIKAVAEKEGRAVA